MSGRDPMFIAPPGMSLRGRAIAFVITVLEDAPPEVSRKGVISHLATTADILQRHGYGGDEEQARAWLHEIYGILNSFPDNHQKTAWFDLMNSHFPLHVTTVCDDEAEFEQPLFVLSAVACRTARAAAAADDSVELVKLQHSHKDAFQLMHLPEICGEGFHGLWDELCRETFR